MDATTLRLQHETGAFGLDISLDLEPGWTAIFGPSGSGKTTVLECIAGLRRPRAGHVTIDGRVVFDSERRIDEPPRKRRVGYVSQAGDLFPHLTVRQNLAFGLRDNGEVRSLPEMADLLEIGDLLERRPVQLSGGQRQRVALGRALLSSPRLLLLDEPLSSLDLALRRRVMSSFARVRGRIPVPCLYVTHSVDEVLHLADQVVLLEDGRITASGGPSTVLASVAMSDVLEQHGEGVENLLELAVAGHDEAEGVTRLALGDGVPLRVPLVTHASGTLARIALRADDIIVALGRPDAISAQNALPARVAEIVERAHARYVCAVLNGQERLWSHITPAACTRMNLQVGMDVTLIVKSHAVRVL